MRNYNFLVKVVFALMFILSFGPYLRTDAQEKTYAIPKKGTVGDTPNGDRNHKKKDARDLDSDFKLLGAVIQITANVIYAPDNWSFKMFDKPDTYNGKMSHVDFSRPSLGAFYPKRLKDSSGEIQVRLFREDASSPTANADVFELWLEGNIGKENKSGNHVAGGGASNKEPKNTIHHWGANVDGAADLEWIEGVYPHHPDHTDLAIYYADSGYAMPLGFRVIGLGDKVVVKNLKCEIKFPDGTIINYDGKINGKLALVGLANYVASPLDPKLHNESDDSSLSDEYVLIIPPNVLGDYQFKQTNKFKYSIGKENGPQKEVQNGLVASYESSGIEINLYAKVTNKALAQVYDAKTDEYLEMHYGDDRLPVWTGDDKDLDLNSTKYGYKNLQNNGHIVMTNDSGKKVKWQDKANRIIKRESRDWGTINAGTYSVIIAGQKGYEVISGGNDTDASNNYIQVERAWIFDKIVIADNPESTIGPAIYVTGKNTYVYRYDYKVKDKNGNIINLKSGHIAQDRFSINVGINEFEEYQYGDDVKVNNLNNGLNYEFRFRAKLVDKLPKSLMELLKGPSNQRFRELFDRQGALHIKSGTLTRAATFVVYAQGKKAPKSLGLAERYKVAQWNMDEPEFNMVWKLNQAMVLKYSLISDDSTKVVNFLNVGGMMWDGFLIGMRIQVQGYLGAGAGFLTGLLNPLPGPEDPLLIIGGALAGTASGIYNEWSNFWNLYNNNSGVKVFPGVENTSISGIYHRYYIKLNFKTDGDVLEKGGDNGYIDMASGQRADYITAKSSNGRGDAEVKVINDLSQMNQSSHRIGDSYIQAVNGEFHIRFFGSHHKDGFNMGTAKGTFVIPKSATTVKLR